MCVVLDDAQRHDLAQYPEILMRKEIHEHDAETGNLSDSEIDKNDPAPQHLDPKRPMDGGDQDTGNECRCNDVQGVNAVQ